MKRKGTYFPGLGTFPAEDMRIWREEWQRIVLDDVVMSNPDPMALADEVAHRVLMRMAGVRYGR